MSISLFRQEAIEFHRHRHQHGEVILIQPISTKLLTWFGLATVIAIAVFVACAQYSRKQTVIGFLAPVAGTAKVFASHEGVIDEILIHQGELVHKGQPLLTVNTEQIAADHSDVQQQVLMILRQQEVMLTQQIDAEGVKIDSEKERLGRLLQGHGIEQDAIRAQLVAQQQQIKLAQNLVSPAVQMHAKGLLANRDLAMRLSDVLQQQQKFDSLSQQSAKLGNEITQTQFTLNQLPTTMGEKIQALRNALSETKQKISEINGRRAYVVRAPTSGQISLLAASPGQPADPRYMLLEIIPEDGALKAELLIPPRAIGLIERGAVVRIRYDAFPYQQFGIYNGTVTDISRTMLTDFNGPIRLKQPAYKVTVSLDQSDIDVHSRRVPLQPDMTLKADVILEKRLLFRWLLTSLDGMRM